MSAKILLWDIETAPALAFVWDRWQTNIPHKMIKEEGYILSWAAKWLDTQEVFSDALIYHKTAYKKNHMDDSKICVSLSAKLNEADILIAHNGDRFDAKWTRKQLAKHNLPNFSAQRSVDTLKVAKKYFNFPYNRLDALVDYLGVEATKNETNIDLWLDCISGSSKAWEEMIAYNIQDLEPLEGVYLTMRPFMTNHPNMGIYEDRLSPMCPSCASDKVVKNGYYYSNTAKYQRYKCNGCGNPKIKGRTNLLSVDERLPLLTNGI